MNSDRICSCCQKHKPPEDFYYKTVGLGWKQSKCKECSIRLSRIRSIYFRRKRAEQR